MDSESLIYLQSHALTLQESPVEAIPSDGTRRCIQATSSLLETGDVTNMLRPFLLFALSEDMVSNKNNPHTMALRKPFSPIIVNDESSTIQYCK
jgi:hypothetical protein